MLPDEESEPIVIGKKQVPKIQLELATEPDEAIEESKQAKKKKKKSKGQRLFINVSYCHYPVVRTVAKNFKMKCTHHEDEDWDIFWSDGAIQCDRLYRMKPY